MSRGFVLILIIISWFCFHSCGSKSDITNQKWFDFLEIYNDFSINGEPIQSYHFEDHDFNFTSTFLAPNENVIYKDSMLQTFAEVFLHIERLDNQNAFEKFENLKKTNNRYPNLTYLADLSLSDTLFVEDIYYFRHNIFAAKDIKGKLLEIMCVQELARLAERQDEFILAQSFLHYGLSIIENSGYNFNFLQVKLLQNMRMSMAQEDYSYRNRIKDIDLEVSNILAKYPSSDYSYYTDWFASNEDSILNWHSIDFIDTLQICHMEKARMLTDHGVTKLDKEPQKALKYFLSASRYFKNDIYNSYNKLLLNYIGLCYEMLGEENKAQEAYSKTRVRGVYESCHNYNYSELMNIGFELYFRDASKSSTIDRFELLKKQRKLAQYQLNNNDEHLNDFMASNTLMQLELLMNANHLIEDQYIFDIIQATDKYNSTRNARKKHSPITLKLLTKVNNFKTIEDEHFQTYKEMLESVINDFINQSPSTKPDYLKTDMAVFKNKLQEEDAMYIDQLVYRDSYAMIYYDGHTVDIEILETQLIDSLVKNIRTNLVSESRNVSSLFELKKLIFNKDVTKYNVHFDGSLHDIPYSLFEDIEVQRIYNIDSYIQETRVDFNASSISILAYSDSTTLSNSRAMKVTELPFTFAEASAIISILKDANLKSGLSCNRSNFLKSMNSSLLHISTHGFSNPGNKLENYLILRNDVQDLDTVFSYEIEEFNKTPEVVILSGCKTGVGEHQHGEGNYSLARSFLNTGTQTCLKTLWNVDDEETQKFMTRLYINWTNEMSLGQALQLTQNQYRSESIDPLIWSGFVLEGNSEIYLN